MIRRIYLSLQFYLIQIQDKNEGKSKKDHSFLMSKKDWSGDDKDSR